MAAVLRPLEPPVRSWSEIEPDLRRARQDAERWALELDVNQHRETTIREQLGQARLRIGYQPEAQRLLEATNLRLHERSLGAFEKLLTALVTDVLQGDQAIKLHLDTGRGLPALSIEVERDGCEEDIWDGNGGALTNVVCAGLRLISLTRSGLRRFLLLDEADNWCAPEIVPDFVTVFADLAATVQVQTVFISHHDMLLFDPRTHLITLRRKPGGITEAQMCATPAWPDTTTPGIRAIHLRNVRRFKDTVIRLGPGVNALVGPNSVGKSTVGSALRAVAYGDCNDKIIRHSEKQAEISLDLENGRRLDWVRIRKGSPKMRWTLIAADGSVERESTSAKGLPDWLGDTLGIARMDGLDIQLLHQKTPIFLLNEPATRQAAVLSVGQESSHLPDLMAVYRKRFQDDQLLVRTGERDLDEILQRNAALKGTPELLKTIDETEQALAACQTHDHRLKTLRDFGGQLLKAGQSAELSNREWSAVSPAISLPMLRDTVSLQQMIRQVEENWRVQQLPVLASVSSPTLKPLGEISRHLKEWDSVLPLTQVRMPELVGVPETRDVARLTETGRQLVSAIRQVAEVDAALHQNTDEVRRVHAALEQLLKETGDACPLCGNPAHIKEILR